MRISVFEIGFRQHSKRISKSEAIAIVATGRYRWRSKVAVEAVEGSAPPEGKATILVLFPNYHYPDCPFNPALSLLPSLRYPLQLAPRIKACGNRIKHA